MTSFKLRQLLNSDNKIVEDMELNRVLYKATLLLALSLSRAYLLLVLGFSKGMYTTEGILLLNGEKANSFDQRNSSCLFFDIEKNFDSSNTLMTTSDAVKLVIRCKLLAWIKDYIVRSVTNQRIEAKFQGRVSGALCFGNGTRSQPRTAISF